LEGKENTSFTEGNGEMGERIIGKLACVGRNERGGQNEVGLIRREVNSRKLIMRI